MRALFTNRYLFRCLLLLSILMVGLLALSKSSQPTLDIDNIDKYSHALAFFVLSWFSERAFPRHFIRVLLPFLICYGAAIELAQSQLVYRTASVADFIADLSGILLYLLSLSVIRRVRRHA